MNIVILGSGHVATTLSQVFTNHGHRIQQVYSRTEANAKALAFAVGSPYITAVELLDSHADLYFIAVSDQAIGELVELMPPTLQGTVVHCSGATPMGLLAKFHDYGVIYPPQSIHRQVTSDISKVPFAVEGSEDRVLQHLLEFMQPIAALSFPCNSQQRLALHVAAVFANNFSNLLFQVADDILRQHHLPFDLLRPIIQETAQKVQSHAPHAVQTGPAKRKDLKTINQHLNFLSQNDDWLELYQRLTEEIINKNEL